MLGGAFAPPKPDYGTKSFDEAVDTARIEGIGRGEANRTVYIEIHDAALEARIQKQIHATGSASAEEALLHLLETQEEQDRWLIDNQDAINAKIQRGIAQLDRGEGIPEDESDAHLTEQETKRTGAV